MTRSLVRLRVPFREPFATSAGTVDAREILLLRIEEDGVTGFGEATPFDLYEAGDRFEAAREEMAQLDLEGRRSGVPLAEPRTTTVPVNFTVSSLQSLEPADYECFKLKVGRADDVARVRTLRRRIGPDALLRVDANGAWTVDEAIERLRELEPYDVELAEQPCRTLEELAQVRRALDIPIAADESIQTAADVLAAAEAGACDLVNVKLAPMGGLECARAAIDAARQSGLEPYLSSTFDGPWGIAASLQLAASEHITRHCGLATLELFDASLAAALPAPENGRLAVPPGPGLGIDVDEEAIAEVLVEEIQE